MPRANHSLHNVLVSGSPGSRKINSTDTRMNAQMLSQSAGVFAVAIHADRQSLYSPQNFVSFPRTQHAADQFHHTDQGQTVRVVTRDRNAAHRVGGSTAKLFRAVHDDIAAAFQW